MSTPSRPDADTKSAPSFIPLSVPCIRGNEWEYVRQCLDTNWVSSAGSYVDRFERMMTECVGTQYAVATVNGTSALHVALLVAGVEPDDEVLTSTLTFIASANAVRYAQAWPVFIDAEPEYWQMDPSLVQEFLKKRCDWRNGRLVNRQSGRRVRAIMPVHVLGHPVDMAPIIEMARQYELAVIEDAAEALGAKYEDKSVGTLGDLACFSFNGNKIITTGGGGMIVTDDEQLANRARYLTTQAKDDAGEYIHHEVGYNYRMPNVLAALGCAQLESLPEYVYVRRQIADQYARAFQNVPGIQMMRQSRRAFSTFWLSTIQVDSAVFGMDSRQLGRCLKSAGIGNRPLWQPMHASPAHAACTALNRGVADRLFRECLSLPSSVDLPEEAVSRVARKVIETGMERKRRAVA